MSEPWRVTMQIIDADGVLRRSEVDLACELDARQLVDLCRRLPCVSTARAERRLDTSTGAAQSAT